jgi:hypothetical protein
METVELNSQLLEIAYRIARCAKFPGSRGRDGKTYGRHLAGIHRL